MPAIMARTTTFSCSRERAIRAAVCRSTAPTRLQSKNGMHFRAIPGNANFGAALNSAAAAGNEVLAEDLQRLTEQGFEFEVLVEGAELGIVIRDIPLPPGAYSNPTTDLLLKTTTLYPWVPEIRFLPASGRLRESGPALSRPAPLASAEDLVGRQQDACGSPFPGFPQARGRCGRAYGSGRPRRPGRRIGGSEAAVQAARAF